MKLMYFLTTLLAVMIFMTQIQTEDGSKTQMTKILLTLKVFDETEISLISLEFRTVLEEVLLARLLILMVALLRLIV